MPAIVYRGDFGTVGAGSSGISAEAISEGGAVLPANAIITGITYTLSVSSTKYALAYKWWLYWFRIVDSGIEVTDVTDPMTSTSHTFVGNLPFEQSHADFFRSSAITVHSRAKTDHPTAGVFLKTFTVTVEYEIYAVPVLDNNYPADVSVIPGHSTTLQAVIATVGNPDSYTYQWYKDGEPIDGATEDSLTVTPAGTEQYYCTVTNSAGSVDTRVAIVAYTSGGAIRVGDKWIPAMAYIYTNGAWVPASPYVYKDGAWVVGASN